MLRKKLLGMVVTLVLVLGLVPQVALADPLVTDVVIHKMQTESGTGLESHDGMEIADTSGTNLEGSMPLEGVAFKYWSIASTATDADIAALSGLLDIDQIEAYAGSHPGLLTGGTQTAATNASGVVTVSALPEGRYIFAEVDNPSIKVSDYIGVPFLLELPAMKVDGTGYFGTGANALHVYPKNVLNTPGLDIETWADIAGTLSRIGSSRMDLSELESGSYVPVNDYLLATGHITLTDLPSGDYKMVNTVAPDGYLVDNRPIYFSVVGGTIIFDSANSNPKSGFEPGYLTNPTDPSSWVNDLIYLILEEEPVPQKTVDGSSSQTFQIGDTITWTVNLPVPQGIEDYLDYSMTDTMDTQLSWAGSDGKGDVMAMIGTTALVEGTHYTKSVVAQKLTLSFDPASLEAYQGSVITITYKTIINNTAVMGVDIYNNVEMSFDNGHGGTGTTKPDDPPSVWTGGARFLKVDGRNSSLFLSGAEFKITTDAAGTDFVKWTAELIAANTAGSFVTPVVGADIVMVSNTSGQFGIQGLAGGTYYLVETKAPVVGGSAYNLLRDPEAFTVSKTSYESASTVRIENNRGLQIPQTGGIGTAIFTVCGVALMAAAVLLFRKKRNKGVRVGVDREES